MGKLFCKIFSFEDPTVKTEVVIDRAGDLGDSFVQIAKVIVGSCCENAYKIEVLPDKKQVNAFYDYKIECYYLGG